ncbi:MAG: FtsQ-type POTRA domain-containing protein [Verrucomicrobia bacterium]|nr:FtsQ-type POTRA domain-containing protein [Verrucomicrobiota bacterium]
MWFKSKSANRRIERDHVLDVKMRARQIRAGRVRFITKLGAIVFGTALTLGLFWYGSDWALKEWLYKNPAFSIKRLDVATDGDLSTEQILAWAAVKPGDSLLAVDLLRIERDLQLQPVIQDASVVRVLPDTLKIRVTEREAIAQVTGFQAPSAGEPPKPTTFYVDPAGYVMFPLGSPAGLRANSSNPEALPMLTGVLGTELRPGKRAESQEIQAALRLITFFERSPMVGVVDLKTIDLSAPPVLQVTTRQGNEVLLAPEDLERQLRRWRVVHDFAAQETKQIALLDLSVSNNVPVRWHEAGTPSPPPAKPPKTQRSMKKHV